MAAGPPPAIFLILRPITAWASIANNIVCKGNSKNDINMLNSKYPLYSYPPLLSQHR